MRISLARQASVLPPSAVIRSKFTVPANPLSIAEIRNLGTDSPHNVTISGWLHRRAKKLSKDLTFATLRDSKGDLVQLVDQSSASKLRSLKPDSIITVSGTVSKREDSAGEVEVRVDTLGILSSANMIPGELIKETKEWPAQYRYIQLRQPEHQEALRKRSQILSHCRKVLEQEQFTEVETPLLFKSTPEGAREFLVPTRRKGYMYALPQSPQQYKQMLMASGLERYYQIAKCFRDEDLRHDRQPEFTQLDLEMAFAGPKQVKDVVYHVLESVWNAFASTRLLTPIKGELQSDFSQLGTLTYNEAIAKYGIDKPDLRYNLEIATLAASATSDPAYSTAEVLVLRNGATVLGEAGLAKILEPDLYPARAPKLFVKGRDDALLEQWGESLRGDTSDLEGIIASLKQGDAVACSDRRSGQFSYESPTPLGRLRQLVIEQVPESFRSTSETVALWVQEFPLFEPLQESIQSGYPQYNESHLSSTHHPFTMVDIADYDNLAANPLSCRGLHYDLVVDGVELGGGSARIHVPELQLYLFEETLAIKNPRELFGHLLDAFSAGCPPHAGLAIGLDRLVAMLCGTSSLRDVIAFPKTNAGVDPVIESPSKPPTSRLAPYHIRVG